MHEEALLRRLSQSQDEHAAAPMETAAAAASPAQDDTAAFLAAHEGSIDASVFAALPRDIQQEQVAAWKRSASTGVRPRVLEGRGRSPGRAKMRRTGKGGRQASVTSFFSRSGGLR